MGNVFESFWPIKHNHWHGKLFFQTPQGRGEEQERERRSRVESMVVTVVYVCGEVLIITLVLHFVATYIQHTDQQFFGMSS